MHPTALIRVSTGLRLRYAEPYGPAHGDEGASVQACQPGCVFPCTRTRYVAEVHGGMGGDDSAIRQDGAVGSHRDDYEMRARFNGMARTRADEYA